MDLRRLQSLGLSEGEISVYQVLLEHGALSISPLLTHSGLKKGDCYNKLYALTEKGLIEEYEEKKKKHFRLVDPAKLTEIALGRYQMAFQAKRDIEALLPDISTAYVMTYHRPGISVFEGEEAVVRTLEDSLKSVSPILSYVDPKAAQRYFPETNKKYIAQRYRLKKMKKMIVSDSPYNRSYFSKLDPLVSEVRLIDYELPDFQTSFQIYDNKITYLTLRSEAVIGVIIEDELISTMHRSVFEYTWSTAKPLN